MSLCRYVVMSLCRYVVMGLCRCALAPLRLLLPLPQVLAYIEPQRNLVIIVNPHLNVGGKIEVVVC